VAITWVARVKNETAPTATGTQDFLAFGMESCAGAVIEVTWATSNDALHAGYSRSVGVCDGTNQRNSWSYSSNAVATQQSFSGGSSSKVIHLVDPATGAVALAATFDGFQQSGLFGGIRLDFTTVSAQAFLIKVWLFGGTNAECLAWRQNGTATPTKVTTGFAVDFVVTDSQRSDNDVAVDQQRTDFGLGRADTQVLPDSGAMALALLYSGEDLSSTVSRRGKNVDRLLLDVDLVSGSPDAFGPWSYLENYTATGFDVAGADAFGAADGPYLIGLAVKCDDGGGTVRTAFAGSLTTPTATGSDQHTFAGFKPGFAAVSVSARPDENSFSNNGTAGRGATDFQRAASLCGNDQNNQATSNTDSFVAERLVTLRAHGGAQQLETDGQAQLADGIDIDWSAVVATPVRYGMLLVEEAPHQVAFGAELRGPTPAFVAALGTEQAGGPAAAGAAAQGGAWDLPTEQAGGPAAAGAAAQGGAWDLPTEQAGGPAAAGAAAQNGAWVGPGAPPGGLEHSVVVPRAMTIEAVAGAIALATRVPSSLTLEATV